MQYYEVVSNPRPLYSRGYQNCSVVNRHTKNIVWHNSFTTCKS